MARPVSYNLIKKPLESDISIVDMPEGHQGEGFFATSLNKVIGLARKILSGLYLLPLHVAVSNSWQPWARITTWPGLGQKEWVSHPANVIY